MPGIIALTIREGTQGTAWKLLPNVQVRPPGAVPLSPSLKTVWRVAQLAVAREAPILLRPPSDFAMPDFALPVATAPASGVLETRPVILDGDSLGMAFGLYLFALCNGPSRTRPLRAHGMPAVSGRLEPDGALTTVDGLDAKLAAAGEARADRVILPAPLSVPAPRAGFAHYRRPEPIAARKLVEAITAAFLGPDRYIDELSDFVATEVDDQERAVESVFASLLANRHEGDAARAMASAVATIEARTRLSPATAEKARICKAIAARSQGGLVEQLDWPSDDLVRSLHRPQQERLYAQLTQTAADSDRPPRRLVLEKVNGRLDDHLEHNLSDDEVSLVAARARLHASLGRVHEAADDAMTAVRCCLTRGDVDEVSRALSIGLRMSGAAGRSEQFNFLYDRFEELVQEQRLGAESAAYCTVAALAGHLALLDHFEPTQRDDRQLCENTQRVVLREDLPAHLRLGALRLLFRKCLDSVTEGEATEADRARLRAMEAAVDQIAARNPQDRELFGALMALERAAVEGTDDACLAAIAAVKRAECWLVSELVEVVSGLDPKRAARRLAKLVPY